MHIAVVRLLYVSLSLPNTVFEQRDTRSYAIKFTAERGSTIDRW